MMLLVYGDSSSLFYDAPFPLRVTFREVDILTLGDANLAAYEGRVVQHPQRSRKIGGWFSAAA
ncbi:hypothetical protein ACVXHA_05915 [Escherichia coli]